MTAPTVESVVGAARFAQFAAGSIVLGAPVLALLAPVTGSSATAFRTSLRLAAVVLLAASTAAMIGQTAVMAGDLAAAFQPGTLGFVLKGTAFGHAIVARIALSGALLACALAMRAQAGLWRTCAVLGALAMASFAWTGHGAAEGGMAGWVHAGADVVHLLAAALWLGALAGLALLLAPARADTPGRTTLLTALEAFSGVGPAIVAALIASGLVNSWFLVGLDQLPALITTLYGRLLMLKLALFAAMLALAWSNRCRLTPALAADRDPGRAVTDLRRSLLIENALGVGVLLALSVLGMIAPVSAQ